MQSRDAVKQMYETAVGITRYTVFQQTFFISRAYSKITIHSKYVNQ